MNKFCITRLFKDWRIVVGNDKETNGRIVRTGMIEVRRQSIFYFVLPDQTFFILTLKDEVGLGYFVISLSSYIA
jgi:hypothetical protein